ncbi:MAG: hypothetical protein IIX28_03355 [Clostridia bacterium]|nr:hypothetical protein [Clostridia bacterium]
MSTNLENLFLLARRARENDDDQSAAHYYEQILLEDPMNWEAVFYRDYCVAAGCVIRDIGPSAVRVQNAFVTAFDIIQNSDIADKNAVLYPICDDALDLLKTLGRAAYNHYMQFYSTNGAKEEYENRCEACFDAALAIGDRFYRIGDLRVAAVCYKNAFTAGMGQFQSELAVQRIREYEPDYEDPSNKSSGGCYVATAVYGSYDCPEVWTLRRYRDDTLAATWYGRAFIRTYYAVSPTLVKWFGKTAWFKNMWKGTLDRMVAKLQSEGVESTPYNDQAW